MAQQTRLEVVVRYFERFVGRFPDVAALASAGEDEVLAAWSGLGYYRRARMLRDGARDVAARFGGVIPSTVEELLTIAGIGRYTAGAVASIAYGQFAPIVDGNIARIVSRIAGIDEPVGSPALMRAAWLESERLVAASSSPRDFNQGLMEIGALICKPRRPSCPECPLQKHCFAFAHDAQSRLPAPRAAKATTDLRIALFVVRDRRGRVLMRREGGKLMKSMFHLPHGDTSLLAGKPLVVRKGQLVGSFRHTVTNRRIEFDVFEAAVAPAVRDGDEYAWVDPSDLESVPHPSYVKKALRIAASTSGGA